MTTVLLPRLLDTPAGGRRNVEVDGDNLGEVIENLLVEMPALRVHLFDQAGALRPHVLCFVDGASTRLEDRDQPAGDEVRFLQAVSGG